MSEREREREREKETVCRPPDRPEGMAEKAEVRISLDSSNRTVIVERTLTKQSTFIYKKCCGKDRVTTRSHESLPLNSL